MYVNTFRCSSAEAPQGGTGRYWSGPEKRPGVNRRKEMLNFQFYQRVKMLFGEGSVNQVGELVTEAGYKKPMIVCDPGIVATGLIDKIGKSLEDAGIEYLVYDKVIPDPPYTVVDEGAALCRKEGCDCVIACGGGGSIDTAKSINMLRFNEGSVTDYADPSKEMKHSPGLISIPTTSGTGSEVSDGMVISDKDHNKIPMLAINAMSEYAVLDPECMVGMPRKLTIATGLDAFSHAAEGLVTTVANPFTDFFNEQAVRTIREYLPRAAADGKDIEARTKMAICSSVGGWMLGYSHTHAGHSFGHVLGGKFGVPHGIAVMAAEPYVIEFNAPATPERTKRLGELMGAEFTGNETPEEIGAIVRDVLIDFRDNKVGMTSIKEFPYDESRFEEVAKLVSEELFQAFNNRKMEPADALEILKKIYA